MVKKTINITIVLVIIAVLVLTIYKLNKNHENKLYYVLDSEIKYAAEKCYLEKKCNKELNLQDLYDNKYIDTKFDPITKEELKSNLKITINNKKIEIEKYY